MDPYADARANMVDGQLRPNKVTDRSILAAMRRLPREAFVAPAHRSVAYADVEVPAAAGGTLLPPMALARLVQAAGLPSGGTVLVLGAGYAAAVFAACGAHVTVLTAHPPDPACAAAIQGHAALPVLVQGPPAAGWAAAAPYDCIFVDGGVRQLPALGGQLRVHPPGRLCAVLVGTDHTGVAVVAEQAAGVLVPRPVFDCHVTPLAWSDHAPGFRF